MYGEMSGPPVSAVTARIAREVTEPTVELFQRHSPLLPGSAIDVELSNVYLKEKAPADASALEAEVLALLAWVDAVEAEVEALLAWVDEVDAELADDVALAAEAVAEFALAVALVAALEADVVAEAASTIRLHFDASVLEAIGWEPPEVWAVLQK